MTKVPLPIMLDMLIEVAFSKPSRRSSRGAPLLWVQSEAWFMGGQLTSVSLTLRMFRL